ncbi:MAG: HAMP domain-containing sensor histidine kinase [Candidatus Methanoperedens sp.]|nr:HAMP domain-containing sensor histidine kinase [Candidatus Methanoperedens sp.]
MILHEQKNDEPLINHTLNAPGTNPKSNQVDYSQLPFRLLIIIAFVIFISLIVVTFFLSSADLFQNLNEVVIVSLLLIVLLSSALYFFLFRPLLFQIMEYKESEIRLKKCTAELQAANHIKDTFTDILRHDLLNPAGVIKTTAEWHLMKTKDVEVRKTLTRIKESTDKLIEMIESASMYAKIESAQGLERKKLDLNEIFKSVTYNFEHQMEKKNLGLEYLASGECYATVNPMIENVFSNLLSNAIKYSPDGGKIEVNIIGINNHYRIYVKDWGIGLKDEEKARLFTRFQTMEKGGIKGTGLGLAIVKRIVDLHGGRTWIEDNPERGSIFYVEIGKS